MVEDSFDVSEASDKLDRPTVQLVDWSGSTITLEVLGNNESGTFRRARMWLNRNSDIPVEPANGRKPISVEEVGMTDMFVREWRYKFRRLD